MGKVQRLSHKQIEAVLKRDELADFFDESGEWIKKHLENVIIGVVVVALVGFGGVYLVKNRHEQAIKAAIELSSADQQFSVAMQSGQAVAAFDAAKEGYSQLQETNAGSPQAVNAELNLANVAFAEGKIDEASAGYNHFLVDYPDSPLAPLAQSGQAACLEASGKIKDAADDYFNLAQKLPVTAMTALSYFDAARCMESLGDKVRLKQVVQSLDQMETNGVLPDDLKSRLQGLKKDL